MSYPVYMVPAGDVLPIFFDTFDGGTGASITLTGLAVTDIEIYKDGGTTQRASDAGYTLLDTDGIDFDTITGIHGFSIDTGDNTDAGFYTVGAWFHVVVSAVTVDAQTVNFVAAAFRIMEAETTAGRPLTQTAALSANAITATAINADAITAAKVADGTIDAATFAAGAINAAAIAADAITAAKIADGAIDAATFAAGAINAAAIAADAIGASELAADAVTEIQAGLSTLTAAQVNAEVVDALATDTYAEPGQGAPAATTTLAAKLGYLYKAWRNRQTQTATEYALYADDTTTKDQEAVVSDDGSVFERGEISTGA